MLDKRATETTKAKPAGPPLDFQEHLARLEAEGLLTRIERPINKETELHPLVRWQFQGGLAEDERRAFLFTNVVDSEGRRYDVPVAIGALAASARIYAVGMGRPVEEIGDAWMHAIANPIAPVEVTSGPCQEVIIKGDELRRPEWRAEIVAGADLDARLRRGAVSHRDPCASPRIRRPASATWAPTGPALKATDRLGVRMAARLGGAGGYLHWQKYRKLKKPMPIAIVIGCAPVVDVHRPAKAADRLRRDGGGGRARRRADPRDQGRDRRSPRAGRRRDSSIEGLIDPELLEPEGPFGESHGHRRARRLQHVDAGHRDHAQAQAGLGLDPERSDAERIERDEARRLRAALSVVPARHAGHQRRAPRRHARAADQSAQSDLRAIRAGRAAHRNLARAARRREPAGRHRQIRHRGQRGHRSGKSRRGVLVAGLSRQSDRGRAYRAVSLAGHGAKSPPTLPEAGRAGSRNRPC